MRSLERARYEWQRSSPKSFLKWGYWALKSRFLLKIHGFFAFIFGFEEYLKILSRLRTGNEREFFEFRSVDPEEIERISPTREKLKWFSTGKTRSGDWDRGLEKYEDLPFHRAMKKRFVEGKKWREITEVDKARKSGIKWPTKPYKIDKDLEKTEKIWKSIKEEGYTTAAEKQGGKREDAVKNWDLEALDEIAVDIDRNGEPLFVDGRHRLSAAKLLGVDEIPVRVVVRHEEALRK